MPDEENSHTKTSHIMFFKQQVLRVAAPIIHSHTREQLKEWIGDEYAPKNHASAGTDYGTGTTSKYGHVKVDDETSTASTNPVQNKVITNYIDGIKTTLENRITALENWINADVYQPAEKIAAVTELYDRIGVREICENKMSEYSDRAIQSLAAVNVDEEKKEELKKIIENLMHREA